MTSRAQYRWLLALSVGALWSTASVRTGRAADMLIADRLDSSIYRYTPNGQFEGVVVHDPTNLNGASGIQISPDLSELYVASSNNNEVVRYDYNAQTGTATNPTVFASAASGLSFPSSIAFNAAGNTIYISSLDYSPPGGGVNQFTLSGATAGPMLVGGSINSYSGLALAPNGALVVGGFNDDTGSRGGVLKTDAAIMTLSDLVPPTAALSGVAAILVHGNDVYVTSGFGEQVNAYNVNTGLIDPAFTPIKNQPFPASVTLAPDGQSLLVATLGFSNGGGQIARYSLTGQLEGVVATAQTNPNAGFEEPTAIVMVPDLMPVSGNWIVNVDGLYGVASNWILGRTPNGQGVTATFGSSSGVTGAGPVLTVTVNNPFTVGTLVFDNPSVSYQLVGDGVTGHALTLDNGTSGAATMTVASGSHTISAPLNLANGLAVTLSADPAVNTPALAISGPISGTGGLVKSGAGTLVLSGNNSYTGNTKVSAGTLRTAAGGTLGSGSGAGVTATIDPSATLELAGNAGALGSTSPRAHIIDNGTLIAAAVGQIVGSVDGGVDGSNHRISGLGTLIIADSSSMQVDGLRLQSLLIGSNSMVTIDASDAFGNPESSTPLDATFELGSFGGSAETVPEPSGVAILIAGVLAVLVARIAGGVNRRWEQLTCQ